MKKQKTIFNKLLWSILSAVFTLLMIAAIIGTNIAMKYEPFINAFFQINPHVQDNSASNTDSTYFPSEYLTEEGKYDDAAMLEASKAVSEQVATEGIVLLRNENRALPLTSEADKKVSLLGISSVDWLYSGYGSGHVDSPNASNLRTSMRNAGFEVNQALWNYYTSCGYRRVAGQSQISNSPMNNTCNEAPWSAISQAAKNSFAAYGTAIITLSRDGGEGAPWDPDLTNVYNDGLPFSQTHNEIDSRFRNNNYLQLTPQEKQMIEEVIKLKESGTFKKIILLLNMSNTIQLDLISQYFTANGIDAMLLVGMGGTMATEAVANVLSGKDAPSGRLTDTFVYDNWSAPAMNNFVPAEFSNVDDYKYLTNLESGAEDDDSYIMRQEGIYVGYRYYETRYEDAVLNQGNATSTKGAYASKSGWKYGEEVAYPFGYGLTYGESGRFEYSKPTFHEAEGRLEITLTVKNTGDYPAKEVVQVYLQKPYTDYDKQNNVEKASIELVGFEKTAEKVQPGETAPVTVSVDLERMKSYDAYGEGTYILEQGNYYFAVGHDAHEALNNVLAKKGKTPANSSGVMDAEGDSAMVYLKNDVKSGDFKKYSKSNNTDVINRFNEADINLYDGAGNQKITYLSRSDWDRTYPTQIFSLALTDEMADKIKYTAFGCKTEDDLSTDMPIMDEITISKDYLEVLNLGKEEDDKQDRLYIINLMDADFDDELWDHLLNQLTFTEMSELIVKGGMGTIALPSINLPGTVTRDGPAGLGRLFADKFGATRQGVNYPSPCLMGSCYNRELVRELGKAFGTELMHYGINGIYAPGAGIHRAAYSGRSWEYYSEDGYLSGEMLSEECAGLTSVGCITYAKHIGFNDQEGDRNGVCVWSNEQSFREIYLLAYEKSCVENTTNALMSSYNRIGGDWAALHKGMLTDIVLGEWGFEGHVITDAYAYNYMTSFADAVVAGNDLWLGGDNGAAKQAFRSSADNAVVVSAMRKSCHKILYTILHSNAMNGVTPSTKIITITPWWQSALLGLQIGTGIIAGGSIVMLVLSFVLKRKPRMVAGDETQTVDSAATE